MSRSAAHGARHRVKGGGDLTLLGRLFGREHRRRLKRTHQRAHQRTLERRDAYRCTHTEEMYRRETARLLYFQQTKVEEDDGAELPAGECDAEDPFIALGLLARNRRLERASLSNCRGAVSGSAHGFRVAGRHGESNTPCSGANRVLAQSGDMAAPKLTTENNANAIATLGTTQGGIPGESRPRI